jgi:hypothetical protein
MRPAVGPGSDPRAPATLRVTGKITLPPRAVSEGMKGASTRSAAASEYPKLSGLWANRRTKRYPMRLPSPVTVKARPNRKARKISQTVILLKPERTFAGVSVRVSASSVMATTTLAPMGRGCATNATMVATKIASRWRWMRFRPGSGIR